MNIKQKITAIALLMSVGISAWAQNTYGNFVQKAEQMNFVTDYNPKKAYKPSKAATKADPEAKRKERMGETVSRTAMDIRGAYEHLPKELFPYQPYYEHRELYVLENDDMEGVTALFDDVCLGVMKASSPQFNTASYEMTDYISLGAQDSLLADEAMHNMACAVFAASPADKEPFVAMLKMLTLREELHMYSSIEHPLESDESNRTINDRKRQRDLFCMEICARYTPWSVVKETLKDLVEAYKASKDNGDEQLAAFESALLANTLVKCVAPLHKAEKDEEYNALCAEVEQMNCAAIAEAYAANNREAEDLPKGVKVQAALQTKANQLLKQKFGKGFVKAIFTDKNWQMNIDPITHKIQGRSLPMLVVVKEDDKYFMQEWMLQQGYKGKAFTKAYSIQPGLSPDKRPVKMK